MFYIPTIEGKPLAKLSKEGIQVLQYKDEETVKKVVSTLSIVLSDVSYIRVTEVNNTELKIAEGYLPIGEKTIYNITGDDLRRCEGF